MDDSAPFHPGEVHLQTLTGVHEQMAPRGRAFIRDHMPDQHRHFFAQLPFVVAGGLDGLAQPWATILAGPPGFMHSPDPRHLHIAGSAPAGDALAKHWRPGSPIGLLGIEPHTRRRNRMNGTVVDADGQGMAIAVRQSFGNCPKYIQPRTLVWRGDVSPGADAAVTAEGPSLSPRARQLIEGADTLFIASASPGASLASPARSEGVDVSHRGGRAGFVRIDAGAHTCLVIPDYVGNFMFNTLGNILLQPKVGLLFVDFEAGTTLQLAGHAHVDLDSPEVADFDGAQRLVRVRIDQGWLSEGGLRQLRQAAPAANTSPP